MTSFATRRTKRGQVLEHSLHEAGESLRKVARHPTGEPVSCLARRVTHRGTRKLNAAKQSSDPVIWSQIEPTNPTKVVGTSSNASDARTSRTDLQDAILRIRKSRFRARIQEESPEGYTLSVQAREARKVRLGDLWVLEYQHRQVEVHPQWLFNSPQGLVQIGVRSLREINNADESIPFVPHNSGSGLSASGLCAGPMFKTCVPAICLVGLTICCAISLPGLGDLLGTAEPIQSAIRRLIFQVGFVYLL